MDLYSDEIELKDMALWQVLADLKKLFSRSYIYLREGKKQEYGELLSKLANRRDELIQIMVDEN